jgi:copper homeostasis protein
MNVLEIACDSVVSAHNAQLGGADRIELCDNLAQGGTTPSAGKIKLAKQLLHIPVFVLIRPRKGDFHYNTLEFDTMLEDIAIAKTLGADGIVSGVLNKDGTLNMSATEKLKQAAQPLPFTFHRAFDVCYEPQQMLEQLIDLKIERILTSGQKHSAVAGIATLKILLEQANQRIKIVAGGGIRPSNLPELLMVTGLNEFHSAARTKVYSQMEFRGGVTMGSEQITAEFEWEVVDIDAVSDMKHQLCNVSYGVKNNHEFQIAEKKLD